MAANIEELKKKKFDAACNSKRSEESAKLGNPKNGIMDIPDCGIYERYYKGNQLDCGDSASCETAYLAASEEERQAICDAALFRWKEAGVNGKFSEPGCEVKWQCNGSIMTNQADYEASSCKAPPPAPSCGDPPASGCKKQSFYRHPVCVGWSKCMGYI